jgi:hypothetical protein
MDLSGCCSGREKKLHVLVAEVALTHENDCSDKSCLMLLYVQECINLHANRRRDEIM